MRPYALRSCRRRAEDDRRSGIEEVPAVVLADPEEVQPDLIGMLDLFDQVSQAVRRADGTAGLVVRRCEAVDADLHRPSSYTAAKCPRPHAERPTRDRGGVRATPHSVRGASGRTSVRCENRF